MLNYMPYAMQDVRHEGVMFENNAWLYMLGSLVTYPHCIYRGGEWASKKHKSRKRFVEFSRRFPQSRVFRRLSASHSLKIMICLFSFL